MMGRETRDGSTAEVISVAEATGQDDQVDPFEVAVFVPEPLNMETEFRAEGIFHIMVAIGPGEGDNADFHVERSSTIPAHFQRATRQVF